MGPTDANIGGNVHGGTIMWMCDEVAGIAAIRHSGCRVVTAGMDRMTFQHPVSRQPVTVSADCPPSWAKLAKCFSPGRDGKE